MSVVFRISGDEVRELRKAFGLNQTELAQAIGSSWPTVQRAEARNRAQISELFGVKLSQLLIEEQEAMLFLGINNAAIERAWEHGLRVWQSKLGNYYWKPDLSGWATQHRGRTSLTLMSLAKDLCRLMGISEKDGLLFCEECQGRNSKHSRIAYRVCFRCKANICGLETCGDSAVDIEGKFETGFGPICRKCLSRSAKPLIATHRASWFPEVDSPVVFFSEAARLSRGTAKVAGDLPEEITAYVDRLRVESALISGWLREFPPKRSGFPIEEYLAASLSEMTEEIDGLQTLLQRLQG